ncbi:MAG: hypothetical protein RMN25_04995 [Anaerolineae bacterium]|nr:hypothetical protein [Thermoflexales bacterium]MDW8407121.1 hypothetical protein [Anaerolineae bacterium]
MHKRLILGLVLAASNVVLASCSPSLQSTPTPASPAPVASPSPDPRVEDLEATRARCANQPLEQGRILFTRAFTDTDGRLKYDLFYIELGTQAVSRALNSPTPTHLPASGNTAQGLLIPGRVGGSLSPDGTRIAYFDLASVIVADANGDNPQIVDSSLLRLSDNIQWSPDGTQIAYVDFVSSTARVATLSPELAVRDEKAEVSVLSISSYTWPPSSAYGTRLYSAGCAFINSQCSFSTVAYLSRPTPGAPPRKVGTNAIYPRWSPVSNLIAALWISPDNPQFLRVGIIEQPDGTPWTPAEALVSAGLSWSPNGCGLVATTLNQQGFFLFDLARQTAKLLPVPDSVQTLHPQWVR